MLIKGVDLFLGVSSMINDWHTLTSDNASWWNKTVAAGDLALNLGMDVSLFMGIGEGLRAGVVVLKGGEDLAAHVGEDVVSHAAEACGLSFSYNTVVTTAVGKLAIGSLKPGEQVLAYNQQTKKMELEVIRHVWITHDNDLVDLTLTYKTTASKDKPAQQDSETVHTNMKHPFLTVEKGFIPVSQLKLGMHVIEAGGRIGVVTGWQSKPGIQVMYNLEVTSDHTYTVGTGQWVVHNTCMNDLFKDPSQLKDMTPDQVKQIADNEDGWVTGTLNKGSHQGQGFTAREVKPNGNQTGRYVQWHPGGGHHGPSPYWKISAPNMGTLRFGAADFHP